MLYVITRSVFFAADHDQPVQNRISKEITRRAIRGRCLFMSFYINMQNLSFVLGTLYFVFGLTKHKELSTKPNQTDASLPLACHVVRRVRSGRDQFHCRWRNSTDLSGIDLARARSKG